MRVVRLADSISGPALVEGTAERPRPGRGELLIRVHAAGVTPTELNWYPATHTKSGQKRAGAIPGHDFSGVVAETGTDAGSFIVGDAVFGMNDWFSDGATAEYCVTQPSAVAPKPRTLSHAEAAAVPISALTAWQGLFDRAKLQPGEHALIHGGAGAVGIFVVQLAKLHGARVTATASPSDIDFLTHLGADDVIDYRAGRFENAVHKLDVVFDTVGGETLQRSWTVLKPNGRMVTIASTEEATTDERAKSAFFIVEPNQEQLAKIGALLDANKIRVFVAATVSLTQAADAYADRIHKRGPGKQVVVIAND